MKKSFSVAQPPAILQKNGEASPQRLGREPCHVRRDEDIGQLKEWMGRVYRL